MTRTACRLLPTMVLALLLPRIASAQLSFAGDTPRIFTIEPRQHLFKHELQLGIGVMPLNAFYVGMPLAASYTYHFSDVWAWEIINGFYSLDFDTTLQSELLALGAQPGQDASQRLRLAVASNVLFKPMYGKVAVFNASRVELETSFTAGVGAMVSNQNTAPAVNVGLCLHFWMSRHFAARVDVRDYIVLDQMPPDNVLMILLSGALGFNVRTDDDPPPG